MTDKERIEYIKNRRKCAEKDGAISWVDMELDDFDWLIEQYEKFQEYIYYTDIAENRMVEIDEGKNREITYYRKRIEELEVENKELIKSFFNMQIALNLIQELIDGNKVTPLLEDIYRTVNKGLGVGE